MGPVEAIDTRSITYNRAAMDALLEELVVDQPNVTTIDIPAAKEVLECYIVILKSLLILYTTK